MADGKKYEGYWLAGLQHGKGVQINNSGDVYEGEFVYGEFEGYGIYSGADGRKH